MSEAKEYRKQVDIEALMRQSLPRKRATKRTKHGFNNSWRGMDAPGSSRDPNMGILSAIKSERTGTTVSTKVITEADSARNSNTPHINNDVRGGHI
jgi:hypothetical protein